MWGETHLCIDGSKARRRSGSVGAALFAAGAIGFAAPAMANLLSNGSFEASYDPGAVLDGPNSFGGGSWSILNALSGWNVSPNIEIHEGAVLLNAADGSNYLELDATTDPSVYSSISQTLMLGPGTSLPLS